MAFLSPFLPCLGTKLFPLKPSSKSSDLCLLLSIPITSTMSWSCKKCTFINPSSSSSKPTCQICLSPPSPPTLLPSSNQETPKWSCKACTFLNSYKNTNCEICGTRASVCSLSGLEDLNGLDDGDLDSSVGSVFLPLRACKRKDRYPVESDQDCVEMGRFRGFKSLNNAKDGGEGDSMGLGGFQGFRASNKSVTVLKDGDGGDCVKLGVFQGVRASKNGVSVLKEDGNSAVAVGSFKILSYNVWFREDLELRNRMKALGDLIQIHSPDVICLQEVTPNIYDIFQQSNWWKAYCCSVSCEIAGSKGYFCMQLSKLPVKSFDTKPFLNSIMGRELCIAELEVPGYKSLVVATSHLESPCPGPPKWDQMYSKQRVDQAKEAIHLLKKSTNVIFCGDMNWDDKLDGPFPFPDGWVDAWVELKPGDNGWTYDTKSNQMLTGNRTLQKRLDRFICSLRDFEISKIDMIGKETIPGLSYSKEKKVRQEVKTLELPVLASDHYGLLLTISPL